ncbi:hypothetical protein MG293_018173, partial [Ovis ammon polii]
SASPDHVCIKSKTLDPMVIFFTSGTTGFPKMAKHNHGFALRSYFPACLRFPTLEHCCTGGEALLPEEQEQWKRQTGILLYQAYGQSETIIDDKGNIQPPNTEGNIGIRIKPTRPIGLFMYYENNPEKTAEVECGDFYNTGDRATIDEEGYFWFLGRSDDVINASGYRIGPAEVENALAEHPAVAESAVVSSPDPVRGEVVKAFIVLNPGFLSRDQDELTKELQQHVKSVTAPYKYPRKVKPPVYQVNLEQISEKINHFVKENRQLAENIASMEQKINDSKKRLQETRRQNKMCSHEALKFKDNIKTIERVNEFLNDLLQSSRARLQSVRGQNVKTLNLILEKENSAENMKDANLANTSGISEFESAFNEACVNEVEVKPEQLREQTVQLNTEKNQLQHANAEFEDSELKALRNKNRQRVGFFLTFLPTPNNFSPKENAFLTEGEKNLKDICDALRSVKAEKEVELKLLKRKEAFLAELYEQRKMAAEEQQTEQMREELQQQEFSFRHQISLLEKKAQDNWIKGRILEREMAEQSKEAAYLRHKLAITEKQGLQQKYGMPNPVLGRPETQKPPGRDSGPGMAPMRNNNSFPTMDVQKGQVITDARGLFPFQGPPCMPYPMGCPLSPLKGCGPLPPPPPWLPMGPQPMPPHLSGGVVGVPGKKEIPLTVPRTPAFVWKKRTPKPNKDNEDEKQSVVIRAQQLSHYRVPFKPKIPKMWLNLFEFLCEAAESAFETVPSTALTLTSHVTRIWRWNFTSKTAVFPHPHKLTKPFGTMKIFFRYQTFRFIWLTKLSGQRFHKSHQLGAPLTLADFEAINRCERSLPKNFNFAGDVLDQWSQKEKTGERPANPALWWVNGKGDEVKWSFGELGSLSRKAANVLTKPCGLERGDRVAVILPRIPEWWLINVACMRTGLVFMPGTTQLTAKDILYRLRASKAKCVVASEEVIPAVESIVSECPDLKTKLLVSPHSQNGWLSFSELFQYWLDLKSTDIIWNMSDTGWIKAAIGSVFSSWLQGACVFVHRMAQFDTDTFLDTLTNYPITTLCSAPTVYRMLVQKDLKRYKFKKLRHCLTGGEPLNPEVLEQWKVQTGLELYEGYGQTEVGIICANQKGQEIKPGSMGKGVLPYDVQDNPEKTAATIRGNFYVTGDRGVMDSDGYFWFVGRADDVIISSGYRIGPFEVESALIEHPAVVESAVVSSPDPVRGEVVKAFVVLSAPFKSSNPEKLTLELQDHVKKSTAPYKYPRKASIVPKS